MNPAAHYFRCSTGRLVSVHLCIYARQRFLEIIATVLCLCNPINITGLWCSHHTASAYSVLKGLPVTPSGLPSPHVRRSSSEWSGCFKSSALHLTVMPTLSASFWYGQVPGFKPGRKKCTSGIVVMVTMSIRQSVLTRTAPAYSIMKVLPSLRLSRLRQIGVHPGVVYLPGHSSDHWQPRIYGVMTYVRSPAHACSIFSASATLMVDTVKRLLCSRPSFNHPDEVPL